MNTTALTAFLVLASCAKQTPAPPDASTAPDASTDAVALWLDTDADFHWPNMLVLSNDSEPGRTSFVSDLSTVVAWQEHDGGPWYCGACVPPPPGHCAYGPPCDGGAR